VKNFEPPSEEGSGLEQGNYYFYIYRVFEIWKSGCYSKHCKIFSQNL